MATMLSKKFWSSHLGGDKILFFLVLFVSIKIGESVLAAHLRIRLTGLIFHPQVMELIALPATHETRQTLRVTTPFIQRTAPTPFTVRRVKSATSESFPLNFVLK